MYHVQAAKATPSSGPLPDFISFCLSPQPSARTEAKNANSCTIKLSSWPPLPSFEVLQQLVEGLLIHVMRLPAPKITNVPGIANQRWPARQLCHDRIINLDREEDSGPLLPFPRQGGFDFLLYSLARHRRLG